MFTLNFYRLTNLKLATCDMSDVNIENKYKT